MSVLMDVFKEELERLDKQQLFFEERLKELPKGYISKKKICNNNFCYLQYREGERIVSKYIPKEQLAKIEEQVQARKNCAAALKRIREDQKRIRKVLGSDYGR